MKWSIDIKIQPVLLEVSSCLNLLVNSNGVCPFPQTVALIYVVLK